MTLKEFLANYEEQRRLENILAQEGTIEYENTGISMMPLLRQHRDKLIIHRPQGRLRLWDVPLFKRASTEKTHVYVMHRVLWVWPHSYIICGDNQYRPEFGVRDEQIVGVLDSVVRKSTDGRVERIIPVRSTPEHPHVPLTYRLYVFLWCFFFPIRAVVVYLLFKFGFWRRHYVRRHALRQ